MSTSESGIAGGAVPAGAPLPETTANGRARRAALAVDRRSERQPKAMVSYQSAGNVLIIGPWEQARQAAERLEGRLPCTVLTGGSASPQAADAGAASQGKGEVRRIQARIASVHGHLGAFGVKALVDGKEVDLAPSLITAHKLFDIVLDLSERPWITSEVAPPGYYAAADPAALERALKVIPEMTGAFEKPRYFAYDSAICAHGNSGIQGCTRCLEACPTDAIRSLKDLIEVDPYLCQGGGSCATACPTGAITYAYPGVAELLENLRAMLNAYREAGGASPGVLFHDGEAGLDWLRSQAAALPEHLIPVEVEEVGSVGLDAWLGAIAYGARPVALYCPVGVPRSVKAELAHQIGVARAILAGMGYSEHLIALMDDGEELDASALTADGSASVDPATFAAVDEKRTLIRMAVDHLYARAPRPVPEAPLPAGAPFGQVHVNDQTCTLCMACVSVCPASALIAGGETPMLKFIEWNCVQCGLCETACPEDAITREPRFVFDAEARRGARVLNQDKPFHCVSCGKVFATTRVIERMRDKLEGHWMFQKPEAVRRLEMCEDCRVKDMFKDGGGLLDVHDRS